MNKWRMVAALASVIVAPATSGAAPCLAFVRSSTLGSAPRAWKSMDAGTNILTIILTNTSPAATPADRRRVPAWAPRARTTFK